MTAHDKILIVDFGSQVTQLIARRVREEGVYCEIVPFQKAADAFATMKPRGVILSGGPASMTEATSPRAPQAIFDAGVPVLGICYGEQAMAANGALFETPITWKPSGSRVTRSPWLIHTGYFSPLRHTSSKSGVSPVTVTSARPNSR